MRTLLVTTAVAAALLAATSSTHAQDTFWRGTRDSNWFNGDNWDSGVPNAETSAFIDTVTPNATVLAAPGAMAFGLIVGSRSGSAGTVTIADGGTLISPNNGGDIGAAPGSHGIVTVTGGGPPGPAAFSSSASLAREHSRSPTAAP